MLLIGYFQEYLYSESNRVTDFGEITLFESHSNKLEHYWKCAVYLNDQRFSKSGNLLIWEAIPIVGTLLKMAFLFNITKSPYFQKQPGYWLPEDYFIFYAIPISRDTIGIGLPVLEYKLIILYIWKQPSYWLPDTTFSLFPCRQVDTLLEKCCSS